MTSRMAIAPLAALARHLKFSKTPDPSRSHAEE